jgi:TnpA family transposase
MAASLIITSLTPTLPCSRAITCCVWEAVHNLDALLKNRSEIQSDTLHADTQGQSKPVFGSWRLLGSRLMPRTRGLSDAVFYRPDKAIRYRNIDMLFGGKLTGT